MKPRPLLCLLATLALSCAHAEPPAAAGDPGGAPAALRISADLEVQQVGPGLWMHTSWQQMPSFGRVLSHGYLLVQDEGSLLIDTPWGQAPTQALLAWIKDADLPQITGVVVTGHHDDRMGGARLFLDSGVPVYALPLTIALAPELAGATPLRDLRPGEATTLRGVEVFYPGPGHTADNLLVYLPDQDVLFGGCALRPLTSETFGYVGDADVATWGASMRSAQVRYATVGLALPSHGDPAGPELLAHNVELLRTQVDLSAYFEGIKGAFVLLDPGAERVRVYGGERVDTGYLPASTFKIPHTLIALETGVASGPEFTLPFDASVSPPELWWPATWAREQTLASALKHSVVWFYRQTARRIGSQAMASYVKAMRYGNQDITGEVDLFWLSGALRITPAEQVDFLRRMVEGRLPGVSARSTQQLKDMLVLEEGDGYRLSGKTGTAMLSETRQLGWLVGYLEVGEQVSYFALNMEGDTLWQQWPPGKRLGLVKALLTELQALPPANGAAAQPQ